MHSPFPTRRQSAYTLVETLVAATLSLIVAAGVYALIQCVNILSLKITSINSTNVTIQNALDRIQVYLQQSYTTPYPLTSTGKVVITTGSIAGTSAYAKGLIPFVGGTGATVTGTGMGIKFYRYVGGPYLAQVPSSGLSSTATSITLVSSTAAQVCPPSPQAGDMLLINTTALMGGTDVTNFQVWATVASNATYTESSGTRTYTVTLTPPLRPKAPDATSSTTSIDYQYDNTSKSAVSWTTYLLRPTAFIVSYRNSQTELGLLEPCSTSTGTSGTVNITQNYFTLTTLGSGSSTLLSGTTPPFAIVSYSNNSFISVNLQANAEAATYLEDKQASNGFSTYMGIRSFIQLKSSP